MWCGASALTWIHETVRHTWRFDFHSSNSFSVVFVICSLKYVEQKESVCFVLFLSFCFCASSLCSTLFWSLVLFCFFSPFFSGVVCFISQAIWLDSESNFTTVSACTSLLFPRRRTHIHTFPQTDTLTSHSKQINFSLASLGTPERNVAAHSSPGNVRAVLMFLVHCSSTRPY